MASIVPVTELESTKCRIFSVRVWRLCYQFCVFGFLAALFLCFSRCGWPITCLTWPTEAAHLIHIIRGISYPIRPWPSLPHVAGWFQSLRRCIADVPSSLQCVCAQSRLPSLAMTVKGWWTSEYDCMYYMCRAHVCDNVESSVESVHGICQQSQQLKIENPSQWHMAPQCLHNWDSRVVEFQPALIVIRAEDALPVGQMILFKLNKFIFNTACLFSRLKYHFQ